MDRFFTSREQATVPMPLRNSRMEEVRRNISELLHEGGWGIETDLGYAEVWASPFGGSAKQHVLIPCDESLDDYELRLHQAWERLSEDACRRVP